MFGGAEQKTQRLLQVAEERVYTILRFGNERRRMLLGLGIATPALCGLAMG